MSQSSINLPAPTDLRLRTAVCSYGYYLLAPNRWRPDREALEFTLRPESGADERATPPTLVRVTQPGGAGAPLRIICTPAAERKRQNTIKAAVARMLRIGDQFDEWIAVQPAAAGRGFGRLFRSPTLFEDMVKTITGCNVTWRNTRAMNRLLVERIGRGAFPTTSQLSKLSPSQLKARCKVGYRAGRIIRLARAFESKALDAGWFESPNRSTEELRDALLRIDGFGPYAAANMLQLLGRYDHLPIDSETYRHFCMVTGSDRPRDPKQLDALVRARYEPYRPYQFLAYWFELWRDYERRHGDAWTWEPDVVGDAFTAARLK